MRARGERGFAVVLSLVALLLVSVALALLAVSLRIEMRDSLRSAARVRLTALSDAGLAITLARLDAAHGAYRGLREEPFDGGTVSSRVERVSANRLRIVVTARTGGRVRTTEAWALQGSTLRVLRWRRVPGVEATALGPR